MKAGIRMFAPPKSHQTLVKRPIKLAVFP
jgi:hypothetical protein